jgi:hypothetical protein
MLPLHFTLWLTLQELEQTQFYTVEKLAVWTARFILSKHAFPEITVTVSKPTVFAESLNGPGVSIVRTLEDFPDLEHTGKTLEAKPVGDPPVYSKLP